ncbi:unnamed protein product [Urochloa decumbens]|uniref:Uncharacterized protein n=1 Tax=Urochloa decumbens TaxID=240449 RepID=A0ABC9F4N7_9POAL
MAGATPSWVDYLASLQWDGDDGAGRRELSAEDALSLALKGDLTAEEAVSLSLPGELNSADELLPLGIRIGLTAEELLLVQLLAYFDRRGEDPELRQWMDVKRAPGSPFFLFMMKASAKSAQVSWWKKKKFHFSPERPGYTAALRIARLGADGLHLEQAGEDGQPGALCYHIDGGYLTLRRPKGVVFNEGSDVPQTEVALIRRLPRGDGISITSRVRGLGVRLGDILFMLPCCAATVALSFEEKSFTVPTGFTEEPLYARVGLNFVDITVPIENLIKKLYSMYEQEEQGNKATLQQLQNKGDHQDRAELMYCREDEERERGELERQRKEQEKEKLENLQRRRAERNKYKEMRKEVKRMIGNFKLGAKIDEGFLQQESTGNSVFRIFELDEGTGSGAVSKTQRE